MIKIIDPEVSSVCNDDALRKLEICGRVCYKSEDRITDTSSLLFAESLLRRGHTSVFEHVCLEGIQADPDRLAKCLSDVPGLAYRLHAGGRAGLYTVNMRDALQITSMTLQELSAHRQCGDYHTIRLICDRGVANELVRHRTMSFSQESTRYVNYNKVGLQVIRPIPFDWASDETSIEYGCWRASCEQAAEAYDRLIQLGRSPQEARSVLPISTKTQLIISGHITDWRRLLALRLDTAAHPQCRLLCQKVQALLEERK